MKFIPRRQKSFWCGPGFQPASRESRSRVAQLRETRRKTTKVAQSNVAPSSGGGYAAPSAMGPPQQTPLSDAIPFSFIPANEVYSCVVPLSGYVTLAHFDAYFKASREPCPLAKRKRAREDDDDDEGGDSKRRCYIHGRQDQPMRSYSFCVRD